MKTASLVTREGSITPNKIDFIPQQTEAGQIIAITSPKRMANDNTVIKKNFRIISILTISSKEAKAENPHV